MTGRAKMSPLAGKGQQILVMAIHTLHSGKTHMKVSAVKILQNDACHVPSPIAMAPLKTIFPHALKFLKMCFHTLTILA
jgi:hypothetical protein